MPVTTKCRSFNDRHCNVHDGGGGSDDGGGGDNGDGDDGGGD